MTRIVTVLTLMTLSLMAQAAKMNQIDIVVFHQPILSGKLNQLLYPGPMPALEKTAQVLTSGGTGAKPYQLLPPAKSGLTDAIYHLNRKGQLIASFSWLQPSQHPKPVALSLTGKNGWLMQGIIDVKSGAYHEFKAQLYISSPSAPAEYASIKQYQRIKAGTTYYFDHPLTGIIIKVHPTA